MFWLTDLSPTYHKTLRTEQLSGTTSSQNILEITFSVEIQKICGASSGLVEDWRFALDEVESLSCSVRSVS